jgi:hypothetical protein
MEFVYRMKHEKFIQKLAQTNSHIQKGKINWVVQQKSNGSYFRR